MELGEKLKQARLEAGLSQRQLCGGEITRNMLSQIENGAARPSMATLAYLADRLNKPLSWFVDANAEENSSLVEAVTLLRRAREALNQGRDRYAEELLDKITAAEPEILRQKLLIRSRIPGADPVEVCAALPSLDEELFLRASAALKQGDWDRCGHCLDLVQEKTAPDWLRLRGELHLARGAFADAAACLSAVETVFPEETMPKLEKCYRELGDYKMAYEYACKQKK